MIDLLERRRTMMESVQALSDPYLTLPFTIKFKQAGNLGMSGDSADVNVEWLKIRINDGSWVTYSYDDIYEYLDGDNDLLTWDVEDGDTMQVIGKGAWLTGNSSSGLGFETGSFRSKSMDLEGNLLSLVGGDNFVETTSIPDYGLCNGIFYNIACLNDISNLRIPATTVGSYALRRFFYNAGGISGNIKNLLPATNLGTYCYYLMFYNCSNITEAPDLPATTLANYCYYAMFRGCTKITTAPDLLATTLVSRCYHLMFYGCTRLNHIKAMFTTTPGTNYTNAWVLNVASTGTFIKNSSANWSVTGTSGVPSGWTVTTASS